MASNTQANKPADLVEQLFRAAFDRPRDPRSPEYKEGVRATLRYRINGERTRCPYPAASAQSDAYYAGINEGHQIWRTHQDAAKEQQQ